MLIMFKFSRTVQEAMKRRPEITFSPFLIICPADFGYKKTCGLKGKQSGIILLEGHSVPPASSACHITPTPTTHSLNSQADVSEWTERLCAQRSHVQ